MGGVILRHLSYLTSPAGPPPPDDIFGVDAALVASSPSSPPSLRDSSAEPAVEERALARGRRRRGCAPATARHVAVVTCSSNRDGDVGLLPKHCCLLQVLLQKLWRHEDVDVYKKALALLLLLFLKRLQARRPVTIDLGLMGV